MSKYDTPGNVTYFTDPNTGAGIPVTVLKSNEDGAYFIRGEGILGVASAGDLYVLDESGRYLGGPE